MPPGVQGGEAQGPPRIGRVGRVRLPAPPKAVERCFRAFPRCYRTRGGSHAILSATRALGLCFVVSLVTQHATPGQAPIDVSVPEAWRRPLSRVVTDPFRALQEREKVQATATLAAFLLP
jgi:hypothetical protein